MTSIVSYKGVKPNINKSAFIASNTSIIGDVTIGSETGIWFNVAIRGDVAPIKIGNRTNIQDGTVIHVTRNGHPTTIGDDVTVGHGVVLHACTLQDKSFVGMGAIILDDVIVQTGAFVAAGALVTAKKVVPSGELWAGNPAKKLRDLKKEEIEFITISANNYVKHVHEYLKEVDND